ncbi:hypothetical protein D6817_02185 [Candidatus Pacearchaeota archaeon]|nr:MAG: hypothetical protein D6817_02185 [Candidatus Pacearchaeota archaeon]
MTKPVFVISGLPGCGNSSVARALASRLGLNYFSPGNLFKSVANGSYKTQPYAKTFVEMCEEMSIQIPQFSLDKDNETQAANQLWQSEFGKSKEFHELIDRMQTELASRGGYVIEGKLSIWKIKTPAFKVWLKASFEKRAERVAERERIALDEAKEMLERKEKIERKEWKRIYGFDYVEQEKLADLVLDTTDKSQFEIADEIVATAREKGILS